MQSTWARGGLIRKVQWSFPGKRFSLFEQAGAVAKTVQLKVSLDNMGTVTTDRQFYGGLESELFCCDRA